LNGIAALPVQDTEEAVLPPAEWEVRHGRSYSDVDTNISGARLVAKTTRFSAARGEERSLVAIRTALQERQRFIHVVGVNQAQDRTDDFGVGQFAGGWYVVENRRLHEISRLVFRNLRIAAIQQNLRPLLFSHCDQRFNPRLA